jgi:UDP-glucose 4-epimerase
LVTGGAGFIGQALTSRLCQLGHDVAIMDLPAQLSKNALPVAAYDVDIRTYRQFQKLANNRYDYIYHLAAQTSSYVSQIDPELDLDTNVKGMLNVLRFARTAGTPKVVFASSMTSYGNADGAINEQTEQRPVSNHGVSKLAGERYLQMFSQFGIKHTIFRLFNVYGPGQNMENMLQGMVSIFIAQVVKGNTVSVRGSLERYRDFVYIDDVVDALVLGLQTKTDGNVYNVGSGKPTTVAVLLEEIFHVSGRNQSDFTVVNVGGHEGDQFGTYADISRLRELGWVPKTRLADGLKTFYEYAQKVIK